MANSSQKKQKINQNNNKNKMVSPVTSKGKRTRRSVPRDSPPQRSSIYRGVTRHRWTGRYEAHLWDKNCWNESQHKKGRQVYLGAYNDEEVAARAYDLAALKYWGPLTILNFPLANYDKELKEMEGQAREEYIGSLRRKSSGFSRGVSKYRGVARHHHNGRWEARIGRVFGNKYLYLGTYATQEEAAMAYDMAAIEYRGLNAVTNFDLSRYIKWLNPNTATHDNDNPTLMTTFNSEDNNVISNLNQEYGQGLIQNKQICSFEETNNIMMSKPKPTNATTALGLLLQSSKFKEMMEMTSVAADCPSPPSELDPTPCTNIPDDIQTYFEYHDQDNSSNTYDDHALNDVIFNELNSFIPLPQMFQCDFDITN